MSIWLSPNLLSSPNINPYTIYQVCDDCTVRVSPFTTYCSAKDQCGTLPILLNTLLSGTHARTMTKQKQDIFGSVPYYFRHPTLDSFNTNHLTIAWYLLTIKLCKPEIGPHFRCSPPQHRKQNARLSWNAVSRGARQCSETWTMRYVLDFFLQFSKQLSKFLFAEI